MKFSNSITLDATKNGATRRLVLNLEEESNKCTYASSAEHSLVSVCRKLGQYDDIKLVEVEARVDLDFNVPSLIFEIEDDKSRGYIEVYRIRDKTKIGLVYLNDEGTVKERVCYTFVELFRALGFEKKVTLTHIRA